MPTLGVDGEHDVVGEYGLFGSFNDIISLRIVSIWNFFSTRDHEIVEHILISLAFDIRKRWSRIKLWGTESGK